MPRIRTADRVATRRLAAPPGAIIAVSGRCAPRRERDVVRAVDTVFRGERRSAVLSISFVGRDRIRRLNARWKQRDRETDVLAFALSGPGGALVGDIYICPWVAAREARGLGLPLRQELLRLVIHGVLHVLGYDHPEGERRTLSPMWRRQERYVGRSR